MGASAAVKVAAVPELRINDQRKVGVNAIALHEAEAGVHRHNDAALLDFRQQRCRVVKAWPGGGEKNGKRLAFRRQPGKPGNARQVADRAHVAPKVADPAPAESFKRCHVNVVPHGPGADSVFHRAVPLLVDADKRPVAEDQRGGAFAGVFFEKGKRLDNPLAGAARHESDAVSGQEAVQFPLFKGKAQNANVFFNNYYRPARGQFRKGLRRVAQPESKDNCRGSGTFGVGGIFATCRERFGQPLPFPLRVAGGVDVQAAYRQRRCAGSGSFDFEVLVLWLLVCEAVPAPENRFQQARIPLAKYRAVGFPASHCYSSSSSSTVFAVIGVPGGGNCRRTQPSPDISTRMSPRSRRGSSVFLERP
jgi:hypothetical protein